ncbi:MAG: ChbG/HpnK family deacetylase [Firmicutes bacterium]|nr:ChbG/HpnK family deacetylase [Bacillota bacterium]
MKIIINADGLGLSSGINDGIMYCLKHGLVTSTSLFVNADFTADAVSKIKATGTTPVGIHLNLTYGKPVLSDVKSLVDYSGRFHYVCSLGFYAKYEDCVRELTAQIEKFLSFGLTPTHLDYHHYFHQEQVVFKAYVETAKKYGLPARAFSPGARAALTKAGVKCTEAFSYDFHDYGVSADTLKGIVEHYNGNVDSVEILTMPGYMDAHARAQTNYQAREQEIRELAAAHKAGIFKGTELINFKNL